METEIHEENDIAKALWLLSAVASANPNLSHILKPIFSSLTHSLQTE